MILFFLKKNLYSFILKEPLIFYRLCVLCYYTLPPLSIFVEHTYKPSAPGPENERTMMFYKEARVDGLSQRTETPTSMEEHFANRDDFLYYRYVEFGKRSKKFGPADSNENNRPILVSFWFQILKMQRSSSYSVMFWF